MDLSPGHVGSLVWSRRARQPPHFQASLEERWRFMDFSLVPGGRAQSHMRPPRPQGQADSPPFLHRVSITLCFCSLFYSRFEANHKVEQSQSKNALESRFDDLPRFAAGMRIGSAIFISLLLLSRSPFSIVFSGQMPPHRARSQLNVSRQTCAGAKRCA